MFCQYSRTPRVLELYYVNIIIYLYTVYYGQKLCAPLEDIVNFFPWQRAAGYISSGLYRQRAPPLPVSAASSMQRAPPRRRSLGSLLLCRLAAVVPRRKAAGSGSQSRAIFLSPACCGSVWTSGSQSHSSFPHFPLWKYQRHQRTQRRLFTKYKFSCVMV